MSKPYKKKKKLKKSQKIFIAVVCVFLSIVLVIGGIFAVFYIVGKKDIEIAGGSNRLNVPEGISGDVSQSETGDIIYYNKQAYRFNKDVFAVLLMGSENYRADGKMGIGHNGQADAIYLCVLNSKTNGITVVPINRDTLADVDVYSSGGKLLRTDKMQICLSFAYGDGKVKSCENVVKSTSRLICNVPISMYAAIDMEAVTVLNDIVGGVQVPEYIGYGSSSTGNMITLYGDDVINYLKIRDVDILDSNVSRIERQKQFINAFISKAVSQTKSNIKTPLNMYNAIKTHLITNINAGQISYIATKYIDSAMSMNVRSIEGAVSQKGEYAVFTPDNEALFKLVIELFYEKM